MLDVTLTVFKNPVSCIKSLFLFTITIVELYNKCMTPWITIVVVAYERYLHLPIIIHSFLTQTNPNWKMVILHDGPNETHANIVAPFLKNHSNISYYQSKKRYNDWGHSLRQWAMDEFVDTQWVCHTNDDNYYVPTFLQECATTLEQVPETNVILYDCLMNGVTQNSIYPLPYNTQYSFPALYNIDMGSFIVQTSLFNSINFSTHCYADALLIQAIIKQFPNANMTKINQTLFVHN